MNDTKSAAVPVWFWVVSGAALVWNMMGVAAYLMQVGMTTEDLAQLKQAERQLYESTPSWATGAFAIGVFGGTLGSLALLLRNALAIPLLMLSLLGILIQMFHAFFLSDAFALYGMQAFVMPSLVIVIAVLLLWFAYASRTRGWLR